MTTEFDFDPSTGEELPIDDDTPNEENDDEAAAERILSKVDQNGARYRGRLMTREEMGQIMKATPGEACGCMGFCAKIGAVYKGDKQTARGMRISGQIVSVVTVAGQWGPQKAVMVAGIYSCPAHKNARNQTVPKVEEEEGRRLLVIDATLTDLPTRIGDVIDVEMAKRGGKGQRHTYARVNAWSAAP